MKFHEKQDGAIGKLLRATILKLGPDFKSKLFPDPSKNPQWRIRIEQMFPHTYTFVQHSSRISFDIHPFTAYPVNIGEWRTDMIKRIGLHFAAMSTLGECIHSLVFGQTHSLNVYAA